jgi:hypothetical protein
MKGTFVSLKKGCKKMGLIINKNKKKCKLAGKINFFQCPSTRISDYNFERLK